jgi:hypothetical protein
MFNLNSGIQIGKYKKVKPIEVKITKSIFEYVDKCMIKLPITARIKREGEVITESAETAKQFEEGDKVAVSLGYNGKLVKEFEGFISRVNFTSPVEVECEGYSYQLRKKTYTGTYTAIELKKILEIIIEETDIKLHPNIESFKIDKLIMNGRTGTDILESIKGISGQLVRFHFDGNILWGGLAFLDKKKDVKYKLGWNVIKDNNLKLHQKKLANVTINWVGQKQDGSKVHVKAGKGGVIKTKTSHHITDEATLQKLADTEKSKLEYDGYEGKITAFGLPYCEHGDVAVLIDEKYKERGGRYIIDNVEATYSTSGFRRVIGIGHKV